jgi:hypothetical protein
MSCHSPGARVFAAMRKAGWLRQLRSLDLAGDSQYGVYGGKKTGVDALFDSATTLPRLTHLRLYELADSATVGQLAAWDGLRRLRTLDLGCDYSGRLFADDFRPTVPLARLRKLSGVKVRFDAECVHLAKVLRGSDLCTLQLTLDVNHERRTRRAGDLTAAGVLRLLRSKSLAPLRRLVLGFHHLEPFAASVLPPLRDGTILPHLRRLEPAGLYDTPAAVRRALVGRFGVGAILFR